MIQQTGIGTRSSISKAEAAWAAAGILATVTGALCTFVTGALRRGCVLVILTAGAGGATGSGKMLIRAVSFFGPDWVEDPG